MKYLRLYLYTLIGIGLIIFIIGYIGINISIKYIQNHYIQLQIDVNKRQAERMASFIEHEKMRGVPLDTIRNEFQMSIVGTDSDKGFLCMYDSRENRMVCHPDKNAIGMKFTPDFIFKDPDGEKARYIGDVYSTGKPAGGIFVQGPIRTDIIYTIPVKGTNWYVNAHENITAVEGELNQIRTHYIIGAILLGFFISLAASITARRIGRGYERQLEQSHREISRQRDEIAAQNKEITDSINYARRIQSAMLPSRKILKDSFPQHFIIFHPKDIVSGDFYWFAPDGNRVVIVAADCTGHGVPGAFMSMLGTTLLNEIVYHRKVKDAAEILNHLREGVKQALQQETEHTESQDGMDIALCIFDPSTRELQYAGAHNPLYLIKNTGENPTGKLTEIKADRMPIGIHPQEKPFQCNRVQLSQGDRFYIFSDGFASQFGGVTGETYKTKRLRELIMSLQGGTMEEQGQKIHRNLVIWQGNFPQVDDILLMGVEVS